MGELAGNLSELARRCGGWLLETLLPPRCFACGIEVATQGDLCGSCWATVTFITDPQCTICGYPFEHEAGDNALCGACLQRKPLYDVARVALRYDDASRPLILAFKHGDRSEGADVFGRWMARVVADSGIEPNLIMPVPLHRIRLWRRRFNQSALLANTLSRHLDIVTDVTSLVRTRNTPTQGGLKARERHRNVRRAFAMKPGTEDRVKGRNVVLVDDVMTTGATVESCARVLKRAGAAHIFVIALARVVRPKTNPI